LYFFRTSRSRSWGSAVTLCPSIPVIVSAATRALTIASSVACTVASNRAFILSLDSIVRDRVPVGAPASSFAVEKAMKMSPDPFPEVLPNLASPSAARRASLLSWWGRRGASVPTTIMMDPSSCERKALSAISRPTGTPAMRSCGRRP